MSCSLFLFFQKVEDFVLQYLAWVHVPSFKIEELEEQCNEIDKERERNAQLSRRLQELETELQDKELVCVGFLFKKERQNGFEWL